MAVPNFGLASVYEPSQRTQLKNYATQLGVSVESIIHEAIEDWLGVVGPARLESAKELLQKAKGTA